MRKRTELEMQNEEYLSNKGIAFVTIVLTANILSHSIFDANRQIVKYLKEQGIHDYASQEKGKSAKVLIDTHILSFKEEVFRSRLSTKQVQEVTSVCGLVQKYYHMQRKVMFLSSLLMRGNCMSGMSRR